jgi:hypothetical protein
MYRLSSFKTFGKADCPSWFSRLRFPKDMIETAAASGALSIAIEPRPALVHQACPATIAARSAPISAASSSSDSSSMGLGLDMLPGPAGGGWNNGSAGAALLRRWQCTQ